CDDGNKHGGNSVSGTKHILRHFKCQQCYDGAGRQHKFGVIRGPDEIGETLARVLSSYAALYWNVLAACPEWRKGLQPRERETPRRGTRPGRQLRSFSYSLSHHSSS